MVHLGQLLPEGFWWTWHLLHVVVALYQHAGRPCCCIVGVRRGCNTHVSGGGKAWAPVQSGTPGSLQVLLVDILGTRLLLQGWPYYCSTYISTLHREYDSFQYSSVAEAAVGLQNEQLRMYHNYHVQMHQQEGL